MSKIYRTQVLLQALIVCARLLNSNAWAITVDAALDCGEISCGLQLKSHDSTSGDAPLLRTEVQMDLNGNALRAVVKQRFKNPSADWVEGVYSFPLPDGAAVNELSMRIGEREIVGEIHERAVAQKHYRQAKRTGRKASLLNQHRPDLFTTKVANIGPCEEVEIIIAYFQELALSTDTQKVLFPMVVGPRYPPFAISGNCYQRAFTANTDIVVAINHTKPYQH